MHSMIKIKTNMFDVIKTNISFKRHLQYASSKRIYYPDKIKYTILILTILTNHHYTTFFPVNRAWMLLERIAFPLHRIIARFYWSFMAL